MMGFFRSLIVLVLALPVWSAAATEVVYPPGSRLGLAPPAGMVPSSNFLGFEDSDTQAAIILASLPAEAFSELERTMTADALRRGGMTLERRESISLASGKAFLVVGRQEVNKTRLRKWIVVGSSPALTALVTFQIPETAKASYSEAAIRSALATVAIRPTVPVEEQLGLLPFKVGDLGGFQVGGVIPGRGIALSDPPGATPSPVQPHIFVAVSPGGPAQVGEREAFAREIFAAVPNVRDLRLTSSEPMRIVGQAGHQIMAEGKDPSGATNVTLVQWLRFGGGGYLQLVGVAASEHWLEAYPRFRAVRDGIEPR
ncbi:MAG TPA: hypothetical protein VH678_04190 [Xanthobacteraceae bacterium]